MGETRGQRLELALELAGLAPEEVAVNILVPVRGTPLELQRPLPPGEAERMFAVLRFLLPDAVIKLSGGREERLGDEGRSLLRRRGQRNNHGGVPDDGRQRRGARRRHDRGGGA